jgi:thiamine-monophosphate kinase
VITVQLIGELPGDQGLRRSGARVGDLVFVSGTLGDAAAAVRAMEQSAVKVPAVLRRRLERPEPRLSLGSGLLGVATAAIDLSDGLAQDLGHLVRASAVGATVRVDRLPLTDAFKSACPHDQWLELALAGGDDYELGFTAPPDRRDQVMRVASESGVCVTEIGRIDREPGLRLLDSDANAVALKRPGYQHFSDASGA